MSNTKKKPVLFITSDEYLKFYTRNPNFINKYFLSNLPEADLIEAISDKYSQYKLAVNSGVYVPKTIFLNKHTDINEIKNNIKYPLFIKGRDVNAWRKLYGSWTKGFEINNDKELTEKLKILIDNDIPSIIQETIISPDDHNYKICVYISATGEYILVFTLKKIHQYPIHYGIGSSVESFKYPLLEAIGKKLFSSIEYRGVGSAEFKYDDRDGKLKLIEINPRYWQQNSLADFCGMNFPLIDYQESTGQIPGKIELFQSKLKWINISLELQSFINYRKEGTISISNFLNDLSGKRILSNFSWDDTWPFIKLLLANPVGRLKYLLRKIIHGNKKS